MKYFKKTRRKRVEAWLIAAMFLFGSLTGCASVRDTHGNVGTPEDGKLKVVTTLFPYYDFARQSAGDVVDLAVNENIVEKSGAWFAYNGEKIGQGRENAKEYLRQNPAVMAEIEGLVREKYGLPKDEFAEAAAAAAQQMPDTDTEEQDEV